MSDSDPAMSVLEPVEQTYQKVVHDPRYSFCTNPHRPVREDFDLCRFSQDNPANCPAFAKACKEAVPDRHNDGSFGFSGGSALASVVFWTLVLAIVVWCVHRIAKNFQGGEASAPSPGGSGTPVRVGSEAIGERAEFAERDPAKLLAGSLEALGRGDESAAARLGHAALVRALEREGHLTVDRSATNGDYARALRAVPEMRDVFRSSAVEVEQSEFGAEKPSVARVARLLARIKPVVERAAAIGGVLLALLGTSCSDAGIESPDDAPGGDSMLRELFTRRGAEYARRTHPLAELADEKTDLVLVDPSAHLEKEDWAFIENWVEDGGTLVLVGVSSGMPKSFGVNGVHGEPCKGEARIILKNLGGERIVGAELSLDLSTDWGKVAVCGDTPLVATRSLGDGTIIAFADDAFLTNASLSRKEHVKLSFTLFGEPSVVSKVDR